MNKKFELMLTRRARA